MKNPIPYLVKEENEQFFKTTQFAYFFGLMHFFVLLGFMRIGVTELVIFNSVISIPAFIFALIFNRLGKHNLAFAFAFFELFIHQVFATYLLGWDWGFQYWLIYLAGLSFFNPKWKARVQFFLLALIISAYVILFLFFKEGIYKFPDMNISMNYLMGSITAIIALVILIRGYSRTANDAEEELKNTNKELTEKNDKIEKQKEQIIQSINYAEKIQYAVIPNDEILKRNFNNYFIQFKPRDIVSGDFYWFAEVDNNLVVVCADCTGHGVPGGFMSMLGISYLNQIVSQKKVVNPQLILEEMRDKVKKALSQKNENTERKDGMDMSVCVFDKNLDKMSFAGANNGIYLIRDSMLIDYQPVKNPIGSHIKEKPFSKTEITLQKGDQIYMFSDGFIDQFGGNAGRKFMKKRFKDALLDTSDLAFDIQNTKLAEIFENWKSNYDQNDDCTLIGIKI